jgi:hypothetical protein
MQIPAYEHIIAMDSAHGVFRLSVSLVLRKASNSCLSSGGKFFLCSLRRAFISCLSLTGTFFLARLWWAFLSSIVLFCLAALLRAFTFSPCLISFFSHFCSYLVLTVDVVKVSSPLLASPWCSARSPLEKNALI